MLIQTEPLLSWSDASMELLGFFASFFATGAVGFRYAVLHRLDTEPAIRRQVVRRGGTFGVVGAMIGLGRLVFMTLPNSAAKHHTNVTQLIMSDAKSATQLALAIAIVMGLGLALTRIEAGWAVAAIGVVCGALTSLFFGQWDRLANPVHRLAGGLWIGTLFILVVAGFSAVQQSDLEPLRRGALAASMVNGFSQLALVSVAVLATSGVITAWKHLPTLASLWTTPYGYALIAKLCVVSVVLGLGAWNWRRQKPLLGSTEAASGLERSAVAELVAATIVLVITSILVSLPSPSESPAPQQATIPPQSLSHLSPISPRLGLPFDAYWSQQQRRPPWQTNTDSKSGWQSSSASSSSSPS
ncbi:MAG: CopD family protein [Acidobacteriota bacterium]